MGDGNDLLLGHLAHPLLTPNCNHGPHVQSVLQQRLEIQTEREPRLALSYVVQTHSERQSLPEELTS